MIEFQQINKRYPNGHQALRQVSFKIAAGEMVFLTGHSGAGKSTLLKLIAGLEQPNNGSIHVNHTSLSQLKPRHIPYFRRNIGIVFQDPYLLSDKTVFDNVALPLIITGMSHQEISRRVRAALDKVDLLSKERTFPMDLSSGERQRVSIARAVVHRPTLLLADEPTGNLDPALSAEILSLFTDFNRIGTTILMATHDIVLISQYSSRLLSLHQGRLTDDNNLNF